MCPLLSALLIFLMTLLRSRLALQLDIVALRYQVAVYQRVVLHKVMLTRTLIKLIVPQEARRCSSS